MQTPAQIEYLKQVILDYNQGGDENYSNILGVYIDAGSGGGGVCIGFFFFLLLISIRFIQFKSLILYSRSPS